MTQSLSLIRAISSHRDADLASLIAASPEARKYLEPQLAHQREQWLSSILHRLPHGDHARLRKAFDGCGWSGADLRAKLGDELRRERPCGWSREQTCELLDDLDQSGAFNDPLGLRRSVSEDGRTHALAESARLLDLGTAAGIGLDCLERAVEGGMRADQLSPGTLARAVEAGRLDRDVARRLGLASNLEALAGDAAAAQRLAQAKLPSGSLSHVRDLALLSPEAWTSVAKEANLGESGPSMRASLERLFKAETLLSRLPTPDAAALAREIEAADRTADSSRLQLLEKRFPHLGLSEIFGATGSKPAERAERAAARIDAVHRLARASEGEALFELELDPASDDMKRLAHQTVSDGELPGVVATLRSYRALVEVAGNPETAVALLDAGLSTPAAIAKTPVKRIIKTASIDPKLAQDIKQSARGKIALWAGPAGVVVNMAGSGKAIPFRGADNVDPAAVDDLRSRPELADLLGRLDFCRCDHCQSLLSPAAYFVDLMLFVKEAILDDDGYLPASDDYHLRSRRPDLWTLRLDCDAIHGTIPTLDIVNDVLEQHLSASDEGLCSARDAMPPAARAERDRQVYGSRLGAVLAAGSTVPISVKQPSMVPQLEVDRLLRALGEERAQLVREHDGSPAAHIAAALGTSQAELPLLQADVIEVTRLFGSDARSFTAEPPDASRIAEALRLTHEELALVLATRFVRADGTAVRLRTTRTPGAAQPDREIVEGLTGDALGRLHRFVRLWRKTKASPAELDLLLGALFDGASGATSFQDLLVGGLGPIASLLRLRESLSIAWEDLAAFVGPLPAVPPADGAPSLLDRRFGGLAAGTYAHPHLVPPAIADAERVTKQTARLSGGCAVPADVLGQLIAALRPTLSPSSTNPGEAIDLERQNLTLLYRHARAMLLLGVGVADLFTLLRLRGRTHLAGLADLEELVEAHAAWQASGLSVAELVWALDPSRPALDLDSLTARVATRTAAEQPLLFAPTVLALAPKIGPELSARVVAASPAFVEHGTSGRFRLADRFDPATPLPLPAELVLTREEADALDKAAAAIAALLAPYRGSSVLVASAAGALGRQADAIEVLARVAALDLGDPALVHEMLGSAPPTALRRVLASLAHTDVVLRGWDAAALELLGERPDIAGFSVGSAPDWQTFDRLQSLRTFFGARDEAVARARRATIAGYSTTAGLAGVSDDDLRAAFAASSELARAADATIGPRLIAADAITTVATWIRTAERLGVDASVIARLGASYGDWLSEVDAMFVVRDALRASIATRASGATAVDTSKVDNALRGDKRDALTEHLLTTRPDRFPRRSALFHYFLIDTEVEGCARTSCVVSATSALQLFVQRLTMGLEGSPTRTIDPTLVAPDEWSWRRFYRHWEASRKIFLYPENYLVPELRDDKTPLFDALAADLLSTELTPQRVLDAYATYLAGLDELGRLTIAGSYHEGDAVHLFGVNNEEPPVYYYRRIENLEAASNDGAGVGLRYEPWRRIDVKIPVRTVAPKIVDGRMVLLWVETRTRNDTNVKNGTSRFVGYRHELTLKCVTLRPDGTWSPAQDIALDGSLFPEGRALVRDPLVEPAPGNLAALNGTDPLSRLYEALVELAGRDTAAAILPSLFATPPPSPELYARVQAFMADDTISAAELFELVSDVLAYNWVRVLVAERDGRRPPATYLQNEGLEPIDGYTLQGYLWDRVLPSPGAGLALTLAGFQAQRRDIDLYLRKMTTRTAAYTSMKPAVATLDRRRLRSIPSPNRSPLGVSYDAFSWATAWSSRDRVRQLAHARDRRDTTWPATYESRLQPGPVLLTVTKDSVLEPCGGQPQNAVLDTGRDKLFLVGSPWNGDFYDLRRLGSTLTDGFARTLFSAGIEGLLSTENQLSLGEGPAPISFPSEVGERWVLDRTGDGTIDYSGPFGAYYREIFFHIPFALASALHAAGDYAGAQRWLHTIFDPGGKSHETDKVPLDRVWRYRELRGLDVETLRSKLSDPAAQAAYMNDPFNPHAIARLRPTAYQNAVVMKYLDVLLDWGDSLFAQFTRESIDEATLLYVLVADLLGDRPVPVGDCLESEAGTYESVLPAIETADQMFAAAPAPTPAKKSSQSKKPKASTALMASQAHVASTGTTTQTTVTFAGNWTDLRTEMSVATTRFGLDVGALPLARLLARATDQLVGMGRQLGVFCVPPNAKLLAYWDRVADRLFKIRNCLDLQGQRRELPLFAPPIDPLLLARMRAAGLTLDDVLGGAPGEVPPYRFSVLIARAQAAAGALQGLGGALLAALEKRDNEQLAQLRNRHQQNLTKMGIRALEQEIESAGVGRELAQAQLEAAEARRDHYRALLDEGLNASERSQQDATNLSLTFKVQAAYWELIAGVVHLVPELGSPFALKFGGKQIGDAAGAVGSAFRTLGGLADASSQAASIQANFSRRQQSWQQELDMAERGVAQQKLQLEAAVLREDIAKQRLKSHEESLAQAEEVREFFEDKLTSYGLYDWYATTLTRLYRQAFEGALALAQLAERAYAFERMDDTTHLGHDYWDPAHRGLLAGERLSADLARLERRFVETDFRSLEVDQTLALSQIDPDALWTLKATGECAFSIDERFYDLAYPGHYRRRIKAVRLTIPAVIGPYTNIGATLELTHSRCRLQPGDADLAPLPPQHTARIATSRAQNDGGVFELSFGDQRYLPFEGAGAISDWSLRLPSTFRAFDYQAIDDVLIHVAYTALHDETLRRTKTASFEVLRDAVRVRLGETPFVRIISFRHEMGPTLRRLVDAPAGTAIPFALRREHLPYYLRDLPLVVSSAVLFARGAPPELTLTLDGTPVPALTTDGSDSLRGVVPGADVTSSFSSGWLGEHTLAMTGGETTAVEEILLAFTLTAR